MTKRHNTIYLETYDKNKIFRKVLDIDLTSKYSRLPPKSEDEIDFMIQKIVKCPFFDDLKIKLSSHKGFHVILFCRVDCDICRICYDDEKHYAYDMNRPEYARNILFSKKERVKIE